MEAEEHGVVKQCVASQVKWGKFLFQQYQASCREESCRLDGLLERARQRGGDGTADLAGEFFVSLPRLLQLRWFWFVLFILSLVSCGSVVLEEFQQQSSSGIAFRFTAENQKELPSVAHFTKFTAWTTCGKALPSNTSSSDSVVTVAYTQQVKLTGWEYEPSNSGAPSGWTVEIQSDTNNDFKLLTRVSTKDCRVRRLHSVSKAANTMMFSLGTTAVNKALVFGAGAVGAAITAICCCRGYILAGSRAFLATLSALTVISLGTTIQSAVDDNQYSAFQWGKGCILVGFVLPTVSFQSLNRLVGHACTAAGGTVLLLEVLEAIVGGACGGFGEVLSQPVLYAAAVLLAAGVCMSLRARRLRRVTTERLAEFRGKFGRVWEEMQAAEGEDLAELAAVVNAASGVRQVPRRVVQGFTAARSAGSVGAAATGAGPNFVRRTGWSLSSNALPASPLGTDAPSRAAPSLRTVRSLDQLYAMAAGTQQLLREKVKELARKNQGLLPQRRQDGRKGGAAEGFVRWAEVDGDAEREGLVQWTPLKPEARAVEKVLGRYGGQVWRLLDVCRESLVLPSVAAVLECLYLLLTDPDVNVLLLRSSLDPKQAPCSGLRELTVSLRFEGPVAAALGVQGHVSELRLIHLAFAACMLPEEHRELEQAVRRLRKAPPHPLSFSLPRPFALCFGTLQPGSSRVAPELSEHGGALSPLSALRPPAPAPATLLPLAPGGGSGGGVASRSRRAAEEGEEEEEEEEEPFARRHSAGGEGAPREKRLESTTLDADRAPVKRGSGVSRSRGVGGGREVPVAEVAATGGWPEELGAAWEEGEEGWSVPAEVLLEEYRRRTLLLGPCELHEQAPTLRESVDQCRGLSVVSTSFPIAAALRKNYGPLFLVMLACATGWRVPRWEFTHRERAVEVRFSGLELRGGEGARMAGAPLVEGLGLRLRGCDVGGARVEAGSDAREVVVRLEQEAEFDEVVFRTAARGDPAADPVAFAIDAREAGGAWRGVAASRKVIEKHGRVRWDTAPGAVPEARGAEVSVSLAPVWFISEVATDVLAMLFTLALLVLWALRKYELARPACLAFGAALGLEQLFRGAARLALGFYFRLPLELVRGATFLGCTWWLSRRETLVLEVLLVDGTVNFITFAVHHLALDPADDAVLLLVSTGLVPVVCLAFIGVKWRIQASAFSKIAPDVALYDQAWDALLADPSERDGCRRIAEALAPLPHSASSHHRLRQKYFPGGAHGPPLPDLGPSRCCSGDSCSLSVAQHPVPGGLGPAEAQVQVHVRRHSLQEYRCDVTAAASGRKSEDSFLPAFRGRRRSSLAGPGSATATATATAGPGGKRRRHSSVEGVTGSASRPRRRSSLSLEPPPPPPPPQAQTAAVVPGSESLAPGAGAHAGAGGAFVSVIRRGSLSLSRGPALMGRNPLVALPRFADSAVRRIGRRVETLGLLYRQAAGVRQLGIQKLREWSQRVSGAKVTCKGAEGLAELVSVAAVLRGGGEAGTGKSEPAKTAHGGGGSEGAEGPAAAAAGGGSEGGAGEGGEGGWAAVEGRMPPLKGVQRASQKLMRAYGADASRLLDVCRFALVFDHASELADMLEVICSDPEVSVVAAKNRMRQGYNARQSAGFRDVHLNLVVETAEARILGINSHVWELQLMVTPIFQLRSQGGHARYVEYRDLRAE